MSKFLTKKLLSFKKEFVKNPFVYSLLFIIILFAFLVRVYRVDKILGFYFDQGRDALVIWDLIHNGNFFLIGPTTGIEGIFRGPWYYWLITPFYFLGQGNPGWPAIFLAFLSVVGIFFLYKLGDLVAGKEAGILAAILGSFSYLFVNVSRWLSNPNPMLLISMLLVYSLYLITTGKKWAWVIVGVLLGLAMQFGSAAEIFYFPAVVIFALTDKKYWPNKKIFLLSLAALLVVFIPQIIFDIRNNGILSANIKRFVFEKDSFRFSFWEMLKIRIPFYYDLFVSKFLFANKALGKPFILLLLFSLIVNVKSLWKIGVFRAIFFLSFAPLIGMLFFHGNEGNVYDYYFTGYYFVYALLTSVLLSKLFEGRARAILLSSFVLLFLSQNLPSLISFISVRTRGEDVIAFGNQKEAVEWVYKDAGVRDFNVDVYVPPVIPYAYDHLFVWYPTTFEPQPDGKLVKENISLLYTLYESDNAHPERLAAWLARQKGIGKIQDEARFGGITVQKRLRIE